MGYSVKLRRYFSNWHVCLTIIILTIAIIYTCFFAYYSGKRDSALWKKQDIENSKKSVVK